MAIGQDELAIKLLTAPLVAQVRDLATLARVQSERIDALLARVEVLERRDGN